MRSRVIRVLRRRPGHDRRILERRQILKRPERAGRGLTGEPLGQPQDRAHGAEVVIPRLRLPIDEHGAVPLHGAHLRRQVGRLGAAGIDGQSAVEDQHRQHAAEKHQERALDELHPGGRDHAGGDDD